jgi:hypothetical protein
MTGPRAPPVPLLWLPIERRSRASALASSGYKVVLGAKSGAVTVLDFTAMTSDYLQHT